MLTCHDINECIEDNGGCEYSCKNTDGGYHCTCKRGTKLDIDGKSCIDINEVRTG